MRERWVALLICVVAACSSKGEAPKPTESPIVKVEPPPTLAIGDMTPKSGPGDGGTLVKIEGEGFKGRTVKVSFGGRQGKVKTTTDTTIEVETPAGTPGDFTDVTLVFEPGGEITLPAAFNYDALVALKEDDSKKVRDDFVKAELDGKLAQFTGLKESKIGELPDPDSLSREEIDKSIKARSGLLRACYQKELQRVPELQGKVVVSFDILPEGKPDKVRINDATTLDNDAVKRCIVAQFQRMEFPPKKSPAKVTYPLIFSQG